MRNIAILGATGYIGKSLVQHLSRQKEDKFFLFARSQEKLKKLLYVTDRNPLFTTGSFQKFSAGHYDVVINCVGMGNPNEVRKSGMKIIQVTEKFDNLILKYLEKHPNTLYINLSSGAVYGKIIEKPLEITSQSVIDINNLDSGDYYAIAKMNSEAKHRALPNFNIVDIRVFSFFSHFIDLSSGYLLADIINSLRYKKELITSPDDIIRDYVGAVELWDLMKLIMKKRTANDVFDIYSAKPVSKFALLKYLKRRYGLQYSIVKTSRKQSPTGIKKFYYSKNRKAKNIGYSPKKTSLEIVDDEIKYCLLP
ncbi:MAG: NAD(P)-dependent oxidoreductase [Candidatus Moranbacteria bacterium]|nr:NAD(P)-dependent oxidoreductase [Candidatus Moranbacteria bacterium]